MKKYLILVVFFISNISFAIPSSLNCTSDIPHLSKPLNIMMKHICNYMGSDAIFIFNPKDVSSAIISKINNQSFYIINQLFSSIAMTYNKFQELISSPSENTNSVVLNSQLEQFDNTPWISNILNTSQPTLVKTSFSSVNKLFDGMGRDYHHSHTSFEDCYIYTVYTVAGVAIAAILIGSTCGIAYYIEKQRRKRAYPSLISNSISP